MSDSNVRNIGDPLRRKPGGAQIVDAIVAGNRGTVDLVFTVPNVSLEFSEWANAEISKSIEAVLHRMHLDRAARRITHPV